MAGIAVLFMGKELTTYELVGCVSIVIGLLTCQSAKSSAQTQQDNPLFEFVFLDAPWGRGLRFRARKLMSPATYQASTDVEEEQQEPQRQTTKDFMLGLQRIDLELMPWLVTMLGLRGEQGLS